MEAEAYVLEKVLFTEADFESMDWHDVHVHAIAFGPNAYEFSFDIDYLFRWLDPLPGKKYYRNWIGPATLVFENVYDASFATAAYAGLTILSVNRKDEKTSRVNPALTDWLWVLDCVEGEVTFRATGYRQFARKPAILLSMQRLTLEQRGGYSFECPSR
jgi:hypothetical protein